VQKPWYFTLLLVEKQNFNLTFQGSANCTKAPGSIVHEGSNLFGTSISTAIITGLFLLYNQIPSQDCINQWKDFY